MTSRTSTPTLTSATRSWRRSARSPRRWRWWAPRLDPERHEGHPHAIGRGEGALHAKTRRLADGAAEETPDAGRGEDGGGRDEHDDANRRGDVRDVWHERRSHAFAAVGERVERGDELEPWQLVKRRPGGLRRPREEQRGEED